MKIKYYLPLSHKHYLLETRLEKDVWFKVAPVSQISVFICTLAHSTCEPTPCQNGGTCTVVSHGYECTCSPGFMGTHCERKFHYELVTEYPQGFPFKNNVTIQWITRFFCTLSPSLCHWGENQLGFRSQPWNKACIKFHMSQLLHIHVHCGRVFS